MNPNDDILDPPVSGIALVGCGSIGRRHAEAITNVCGPGSLKFVADADDGAASRFAEAFGARPVTVDELIAYPPGLVMICTPNESHHVLARRFLGSGISVVLEHPLAVRAREAHDLVELERTYGGRLYVVRQRRFLPSVQRLRQALASGVLSPPIEAEALVLWNRGPHYYESKPWTRRKANGGVLLNQGSHFVDLLIYLFGVPTEITGVTGNLTGFHESEDTTAGQLCFSLGATVSFVITTAVPEADRAGRLTVRGANGEMRLEGLGWERLVNARGGIIDEDEPTTTSGDHRGYIRRVLENLRGHDQEVVRGADAVVTTEVIETMYQTLTQNNAAARSVLDQALEGAARCQLSP